MKNFVQEGRSLPLTAPRALSAGGGFLVGAIFAVAAADAANGAAVEGQREGVFDLTKEPSLAISAGARVFWDNTNFRVTTTTTSNFAIGYAALAALAADTTVRVVLGPAPPAGT
jgi:predicted RecA/RadA family phage recombinase